MDMEVGLKLFTGIQVSSLISLSLHIWLIFCSQDIITLIIITITDIIMVMITTGIPGMDTMDMVLTISMDTNMDMAMDLVISSVMDGVMDMDTSMANTEDTEDI